MQTNQSAVLCYVSKPFAWFTTRELSEQRGDDWDDAPYEHNAGWPYGPCWHNEPKHRNNPDSLRGWRPGTQEPYSVGEMCQCESCKRDWSSDGTPKFELFRVAFDGPFETPAETAYDGNSRFSVVAINRGDIAWLIPSCFPDGVKEFSIPAGTSYSEFRRLVLLAGGMVYEPVGKDSCAD